MQGETLIAIVISSIASPILVKTLEFIFGVITLSKNKSTLAIQEMGKHIAVLEKQIIEMKESHSREMEGMRHSMEKDYNARYEVLHKEIDAIRNENVKLQILVAENAVKLTLKDETIARLTGIIHDKKDITE